MRCGSSRETPERIYNLVMNSPGVCGTIKSDRFPADGLWEAVCFAGVWNILY